MILLWPWVTCFRPPCTVKPTRCKRDLSVVVVFCFSACLFVCLFVCFFSSTLIQFLKDRRSFTNIAVCQDLVLTITLYQNKSLQRARASLNPRLHQVYSSIQKHCIANIVHYQQSSKNEKLRITFSASPQQHCVSVFSASPAEMIKRCYYIPNQWMSIFAHSEWLFKLGIFNNYSPKWTWIAVDIYRVSKRRGPCKYPPLFTDTEVNTCVYSIYQTSE